MMLFDAPLVPGLGFVEDFIAPADESELIANIEALDLSPFRFQGWTGKRLTRTFGWRYNFDDRSFAPVDPIPDWLLPLHHRAARFANFASGEFVHALVTRYDPGAPIGWHRDRPQFGEVVGVSLGSAATLRFRRRSGSGFQRASLELLPRSAYHLSGEARWDWEHSIAPAERLRFSITFRTLSDTGRAATGGLPPELI